MQCNALGCSKEATLHCPTCQKKGKDRLSSAFCSQECFKASWKEHKAIHEDCIKPTGNYTYVMIPTDPSEPFVGMTGDLSRGLETDDVQAVARQHFFGDENHRMFQMVDICTLLIACNANGFIGISMYSSGDHSRPLNCRATDLVQACGHLSTKIYGDSYISRCYDNEAQPWVRRDITAVEVDCSALWVAQARLLNHGRNMDSYTSGGAAEKAIHQLVKGGVEKTAEAITATMEDDWMTDIQPVVGKKVSGGRNQNKRWAKGKGGYYRPAALSAGAAGAEL